jgi:hypothetical protein
MWYLAVGITAIVAVALARLIPVVGPFVGGAGKP